ncbi:MAG: 30S ribosomal protein S12 methylthiotransferase RimO [Treponema sp.]|nr:30S ribosomal protein S12 methylthiotransferase RimO [Treponema sp.]
MDPFGCVKNQVDAENMMSRLNNSGWEHTADSELADTIIVNSCGFIESAKQESINAVLEWRKLYPNKKIILAGCLSQRYAEELPKILPEADEFIGVGNIPEKTNGFGILTGERPLLSLPGSAYVKISEGCNNNCSYCAIPLIRGSLVCRTIPDIVEECRTLLARGIKELCIIGQDIGAYISEEGTEEKKESGLPELLNALSKLKGDFWVRLLYIHPDHFPLEILDLMERDSRFLPYFDIPFQQASQNILTAMNRHDMRQNSECQNDMRQNTAAEKYLKLLDTIRARLPNAVIRSTFLLGFPGETDKDFEELLGFQHDAGIDWLGCFAYSREEETAAYAMKKQVKTKIAEERKKTIEEMQVPIMEQNMERFVGQTLDVIIEELIEPAAGSNDKPIWLGRLYCHAPEIDGSAVITSCSKNLELGTLVPCKVIARRGFDLEVQIAL